MVNHELIYTATVMDERVRAHQEGRPMRWNVLWEKD